MNKRKLEKRERNKKDKVWREAIKERDKVCVICLSSKFLNCHHIFPRNLTEFRWDLKNGILLCPKHHKWGTYSAHKNGLWFVNWLIENRTEQYVYLTSKLSNQV